MANKIGICSKIALLGSAFVLGTSGYFPDRANIVDLDTSQPALSTESLGLKNLSPEHLENIREQMQLELLSYSSEDLSNFAWSPEIQCFLTELNTALYDLSVSLYGPAGEYSMVDPNGQISVYPLVYTPGVPDIYSSLYYPGTEDSTHPNGIYIDIENHNFLSSLAVSYAQAYLWRPSDDSISPGSEYGFLRGVYSEGNLYYLLATHLNNTLGFAYSDAYQSWVGPDTGGLLFGKYPFYEFSLESSFPDYFRQLRFHRDILFESSDIATSVLSFSQFEYASFKEVIDNSIPSVITLTITEN